MFNDRYLAADGIENVIRVLEQIDNSDFPELEFVELNACNGGCVGGGAGTLAEIATAWSMYKLIIAWNKNGWSAKLANKKVDERQRYGDSRDDKVYSFESANEGIELISELGSKYQKEYKGIKWRKSK